ncbi:MAG TPA: S8 family serine peptidase [Ignavibacteriaceae bacterium]|nr:S8 family serine peptidase [Ignavibacteriaceae bacterium]
MKILLFLFLLVPLTFSFCGGKYFIYFRDKGPVISLQKNSPAYKKAIQLLSSHAIERREKIMNADSIITFEDIPVYEGYLDKLTDLGIKIENKLNWFNAVSAYLNDNQKQQVLAQSFVQNITVVKTINFEKDVVRSINISKPVTQDALDYGNSYDQLALSDIPVVHSKGISGEGIIVGLLDTGFRTTHEGLKDINVITDSDFVFHDGITANQPEDNPSQDSHGTYVLSVIGGYKDSTMIGASYGASFILAKTEDIRSETHIEEDNYAAALEWMENLGVDVTSSSLGYNIFDNPDSSYTYQDMNGKTAIVTKAAELAFNRGVVTITAAGNEGNVKWHYIIAPADGFNTLAVGAVDDQNLITPFSSRGPTYDGRIKPDIAAMGVNVFGASTSGPNNFTYANGTSAATPIAGGVAALLLSIYPHLTNLQVRDIFHETSDNANNPDNDRGYGLLSAAKAISFPNLKSGDGEYILYKSFIDSHTNSNVQLHYSTDNINFDILNMKTELPYKFSVNLPGFTFNQVISFYFTYSDESGNIHRDPEINNYKFLSGSMNISLNLPLGGLPTNYVLSNNYPNPFNSITRINFVASANLQAELIVYDILGRKVKTIFKGISYNGINTVFWDGTTDNSVNSASGIYFYVLNLNGSLYTNKMVYLK